MANFKFNIDVAEQVITRGELVPTKIIAEGLLSETSEAHECFTNQKFSGNLQAFMVNYVVTISGYYSIYV
jgi:hypothetical protein